MRFMKEMLKRKACSISFICAIIILFGGLTIMSGNAYGATGGDDRLGIEIDVDNYNILVGDTGVITVKFDKRRSISNVSFGSFTINPRVIEDLINKQEVIEFPLWDTKITKTYKFTVDKNLCEDIKIHEGNVSISGKYEYKYRGLFQEYIKKGEVSNQVKIKKGQIKVKVLDQNGENITSSEVLATINNNEVTGVYSESEQCIIFDYVPTGSYDIAVGSIEGYTLETSNKSCNINFDNNEETLVFNATKNDNSGLPIINVDSPKVSPDVVTELNSEINITYDINPQSFIPNKNTLGDQYKIKNAKLIFELGDGFETIEGLTHDGSGIYSINLDKLLYSKNELGEYVCDSFPISFKVKNISNEYNTAFKSASINYEDLEGNPINKDIMVPTINKVAQDSVIDILEIEPADSFKLSMESGSCGTGIEEQIVNIDEKDFKVRVHHITMSEFIGKTEKVNGKYDVIVIGKWKDTSLKLPNGNNGQGTYWFNDYSLLENDITNRKAQEIIDFINSGQIVYIDNNISKIDKNMKLYKNLYNDNGSIKINKDNLKADKEVNQLTIEEIVKTYNSHPNTYKKPYLNVEVVSGQDDFMMDYGVPENRNMEFSLDIGNFIDDKQEAEISLYLDFNGDGLFKDEEKVLKEAIIFPITNYKLEYTLNEKFMGYLDWKIEVKKSKADVGYESIKSYSTGNILFRRLEGQPQKEVRVLQILSHSSREMNNANAQGSINNNRFEVLDLEKNQRFKELLDEKNLKDYKIIVKSVSYDEFNENNIQLNGYYDMVIVGFKDSYGDKINQTGLNQIEEFINTGQGLMLTHDTIYFDSSSSLDKIGDMFREKVGQRRYKNEEGYDKDTPNSYNTRKREGGTLYRQVDGATGILKSFSTEVYKTNDALITSYPFDLGETIQIRRTHAQYFQLNFEDEDVVPWFNFTSNNNGSNGGNNTNENTQSNYVNKYDSRNSYYTYSKRNITFSGTGEETREYIHYPDSELMLFVNTIIKAERGANKAPEINVTNMPEEIYTQQGSIDFIVTPTDFDDDSIFVKRTFKNGSKWSETTDWEKKKHNQSFPVSFNLKDLSLEKGDNIEVIIEGKDEDGASAETKKYNINVTDVSKLNVKFYPENEGYLIGDEAKVYAEFQHPGDNNGTKFTDANFDISESSIDKALSFKGKNDNKEDSKVLSFGEIEKQDTSDGTDKQYYNFEILNDNLININTSKACKLSGKYIYNVSKGNYSQLVNEGLDTVLNVKRGQTKIKFENSDGSIYIGDIGEIAIRDGNRTLKKQVDTNTGVATFDRVPTGEYIIELPEVSGITFKEKESKATNGNTFSMNFNNNVVERVYVVEQTSFDIRHGLYGGVKSDRDGQYVEILESETGFEVAAGSSVNFGAEFSIVGNDSKFKLDIDTKLQGVSSESIEVYKISSKENKIKLDKLDVSIISSGANKFDIELKNIGTSSLSNKTKILVLYNGKVKSDSKEQRFKNKIEFSKTSYKEVEIYTPRSDGDKIKLPNLF